MTLGVLVCVALGLGGGVRVGVSEGRRAMPSSGISPLTKLSAPKTPRIITSIRKMTRPSGERRLGTGKLMVGSGAERAVARTGVSCARVGSVGIWSS